MPRDRPSQRRVQPVSQFPCALSRCGSGLPVREAFGFIARARGQRRGQQGNQQHGQPRRRLIGAPQTRIAQIVNAMVPLANMFGYINSLRSMSQGRASYTMQFDHYDQVPTAVAQEVQKKFA